MNLFKELWVEMADCVVSLLNRCSTRNLEKKSLQEAWTEKKPDILYLKVFESIAYAQIPGPRRTRLDDKSAKYIFIRYDAKSKAYKLFDPNTFKLYVSRDA